MMSDVTQMILVHCDWRVSLCWLRACEKNTAPSVGLSVCLSVVWEEPNATALPTNELFRFPVIGKCVPRLTNAITQYTEPTLNAHFSSRYFEVVCRAKCIL